MRSARFPVSKQPTQAQKVARLVVHVTNLLNCGPGVLDAVDAASLASRFGVPVQVAEYHLIIARQNLARVKAEVGIHALTPG